MHGRPAFRQEVRRAGRHRRVRGGDAPRRRDRRSREDLPERRECGRRCPGGVCGPGGRVSTHDDDRRRPLCLGQATVWDDSWVQRQRCCTETDRPEDLRRRYDQMPIEGPDTVTVPGVIDAWQELSAREGRLPLEELLQSAIRFARDGCEVTSSLARAVTACEGALRDDDGMRSVFVPHGEPLSEGEVLVQPALADTLGRIAGCGAAEFYSGDVGRRFTHTLGRKGFSRVWTTCRSTQRNW